MVPTITVRARTTRTIFAAGVAIGPKPITIAASPQTLRDLWDRRASLYVGWPTDYCAPDGTYPGQVQLAEALAAVAHMTATEPTANEPTETPPKQTEPVARPPEALVPVAFTPTAAPPTTATTALVRLADLPRPPPDPVWVRPPVVIASTDEVRLVPYRRPEEATVCAGLLDRLAETLRRTGLKPSAPAQERDLTPGLTLERLLDSLAREGAGMVISRAQRALVRATDGRATSGLIGPPEIPDTTDPRLVLPLSSEEHRYHFGTPYPFGARTEPPRKVYLRSGIRSGKTYIAAIAMIKCGLTCSTRRPLTAEERMLDMKPDGPDGMVHALQRGERIKVFLVTPKVAQSAAAFNYIVGAIVGSPRLSKLIIKQNTEEIVIRRPVDGVEVVFRCEAASAKGNNIRSGWLAGALFDESAFFDSGQDSAVTLEDNVTAAVSRLLPGGQVWMPSSPWADNGYWHDEFTAVQKEAAEVGAATAGETDPAVIARIIAEKAQRANAVAFHSSSRGLNPALPVGLEDTVTDPMERAREYDALPVSALSNLFFPPMILNLAVNVERTPAAGTAILDPIAGIPHHAGADFAFKENSSTLGIARNELRMLPGQRQPVEVAVLAYHEERIPLKAQPLLPSEVVSDFGRTCQAYGCSTVRGDLHDAASVGEHLSRLPGLPITYNEWAPTQEKNAAMFSRIRDLMSEGRIELPNDPRLIQQMKLILGRKLPGGKFAIVIPRQGRAHCDLVVAVVHALAQAAENQGGGIAYESSYDQHIARISNRIAPRHAEDEGYAMPTGGPFAGTRNLHDW